MALFVISTWMDYTTTKEGFALGFTEKHRIAKWLQDKLGLAGKAIFDVILVGGVGLLLASILSFAWASIFVGILTLAQGFVAMRNKDLIDKRKS